jgi:hypothetical protein
MMQKSYIFDPYPLQITMQRLAENLKARRLEKKLSTKSLAKKPLLSLDELQEIALNVLSEKTDEQVNCYRPITL